MKRKNENWLPFVYLWCLTDLLAIPRYPFATTKIAFDFHSNKIFFSFSEKLHCIILLDYWFCNRKKSWCISGAILLIYLSLSLFLFLPYLLFISTFCCCFWFVFYRFNKLFNDSSQWCRDIYYDSSFYKFTRSQFQLPSAPPPPPSPIPVHPFARPIRAQLLFLISTLQSLVTLLFHCSLFPPENYNNNSKNSFSEKQYTKKERTVLYEHLAIAMHVSFLYQLVRYSRQTQSH